MNNRCYKKIFIKTALLAGAAALLFSGGVSSSFAEASPAANAAAGMPEARYRAEVENIRAGEYFSTVKKALSEAKSSIYMVMFVVRLMPYDKTSGVYQLMNELVNAHDRGVKVTLILDQNVDFLNKSAIDEWEIEGKNAWCFAKAKQAGIDVFYDSPEKYTHSKALVIDEELTILGSSNWTESALHRNIEANVLIRSKDFAKELLQDFEKIERYSKADDGPRMEQPPVPVSWKFLEDPKLGGRMISAQDERGFDLYLLLLRQYDGNPQAAVQVDYDKAAKALGLYDRMDRSAYRRQITKALRRLANKYRLIELTTNYSKDATVRLLSYDDPDTPYSYPKEWYFHLPDTFFEYGWNRSLSFPARYCYLINLAYASISNAKPWWFSSRDVLSERFHIGKSSISKGMQELQRLNIIDVAYPPLDIENPANRLAKSYKLLKLYDPAWLESEWSRLSLQYDPDAVKRARGYAEVVFEENDPAIIEDIIRSINAYGEEKVKEAFDIAAEKRTDNPKRSYPYVKGIIEKLQ